MGACFDNRTYRVEVGQAAVRTLFADDQDDDRYDNGNSYSGGIGMANGLKFPSIEVFPDENAAYDWVCDNAQKWGPALAVQFLSADGKKHWFVGAWCSS